jgi:transposase
MDAYMDVLPSGFAGRLEVVEGRSGRRRWSDEEKARIASESYRPGVQVADVARRHGTTRWQIYDWRTL